MPPRVDPAAHRRLAGMYFFIAVTWLGLALWFGTTAWKDEGPPPLDGLATATGGVQDLWARKGEVGFRLSGQPLRFEVPSNLEPSGLYDALAQGNGESVSVRYDATDRRHPWFTHDNDFYLVFAVERGDEKLLDYHRGVLNWHADTHIGRWAAPIALLVALLCASGGVEQLQLARAPRD